MRIAIVYATCGGTTRECARLLGEELKNHSVELIDMSVSTPNLGEYDTVIVGFSVRFGKPMKKARRFLKENAEQLKNVRAAYFICCGFVDCFEEYAERGIPAALRERAVDIACLGGSLDPDKFKGFDRLIVKAVRNEILGGGDNGDERKDMSLPTIMEANITQFADKIRNV